MSETAQLQKDLAASRSVTKSVLARRAGLLDELDDLRIELSNAYDEIDMLLGEMFGA